MVLFVVGGDEGKSEDMVTQLLEDAMETEVKHNVADGRSNRHRLVITVQLYPGINVRLQFIISGQMAKMLYVCIFSFTDYDKYGFSLIPLGGDDDLVAKANNLQRKSEELKGKVSLLY